MGEQKNYIEIIEDIQKVEKINIENRDEFDSLPKMLMSLVYTQDAKPRILTVFLALLTLVATLIINSTKQVQDFISLIDYISTFPQFLNLITINFTICLCILITYPFLYIIIKKGVHILKQFFLYFIPKSCQYNKRLFVGKHARFFIKELSQFVRFSKGE